MPNWCENELTITGPDVHRVLEAVCSQNEPQPMGRCSLRKTPH